MRGWIAVLSLTLLAQAASAGASNDFDWTRFTPPTVPSDCARAYDPPTHRLVLFPTTSSPVGQIWSRVVTDGALWERLDLAAPGLYPGFVRAAIDDPQERSVILVRAGSAPGGVASPFPMQLEALVVALEPAPHVVSGTSSNGPHPSDRRDFALALDSRRHCLLLVGGALDGHPTAQQSDVWSLSLDGSRPAWTRLDGADLPEARAEAAAVYDSVGDRVLLYGGSKSVAGGGGTVVAGELLALQMDEAPHWVPLTAAGAGPPLMIGAAAIASPDPRSIVVAAGSFAPGQIWTLSLSPSLQWSGPRPGPSEAIISALFPTGDSGAVLALTPPLDTWRVGLVAPSTWTLLDAPFRAGPPLQPQMLLADPVTHTSIVAAEASFAHRDGMVIDQSTDLWRLTPGLPPRWERLSNVGMAPPPVTFTTRVFDSRRMRWILMGQTSFSAGPVSSPVLVWTLDLVPAPHWSPLEVSGSPPDVWGAAAAYDPLRDRVLVFGGGPREGSAVFSYLELGATPRWVHPTQPSRAPQGRALAALAWDPPRDRFLLFGGRSTRAGGLVEPTYHDHQDLWSVVARESVACESLITYGYPPRAQAASFMFYEPSRDALGLLYGGTLGGLGDAILGDLRELGFVEPLAWGPPRRYPSASAPPPGIGIFGLPGASSFDASLDRVVAVRGENEVWTLDRGQPTHVALVDLEPNEPTNMLRPDAHGFVTAAILSDPAFDARTVDPASVTLAGAAARLVPAAPKASSAAAASDRATLRDVNHDGLPDLVLRFARADMTLDPSVDVVGLTGRTRNGEAVVGWDVYRLSGDGGRGVAVDVLQANGDPDAPVEGMSRLAISVPGPVRGIVNVRLALPRASRGVARDALEIFSVDGRRVAHHSIGILAAGDRAFSLDETRGLAPGIYLARVRVGDDIATTKFVVLR